MNYKKITSNERYLISIIQDLVFAYINKDVENIHEYEKTALKTAYNINSFYDVQTGKYSDGFWNHVRDLFKGR